MQQACFDVVVVGAGSAGVAAAIAAARQGLKVALVEAGAMPGGELLTGMTVDGAINARGQQIAGGILNDLLERCKELDGFVRHLNDWRLIQYVAYDPEIMKLAVADLLFKAGVHLYLHSFADEVVHQQSRITGVVIRNKAGRTLLAGKVVIDCSGDGDLCMAAGGSALPQPPAAALQPVSLMFRLSGVDTQALLAFAKAHPENLALGESPAIRGGRTNAQIVDELIKQGQPCVFFKGDGPLLQQAFKDGSLYRTALIMIQPTSEARREVCVNSTRVSMGDATNTSALSNALGELARQVHQCVRFLVDHVPGFAQASLAGLAPRIGIRETRRIAGEYVLTSEDVRTGRKFEDGIAKGCHHIDIHQAGVDQVRIPVADGGSYDIPYRCLIPRGLANVLVAGRCFSAEREAHASARVMGGCIAMGQAAGVAAALALRSGEAIDMRQVDTTTLRQTLIAQGAILEGVA